MLAAVEGGGTSFVVAIACGEPSNVIEREEFPTTTPEETIKRVTTWLSARHYDALGVATFGPVDLNTASPTYGFITTTPKPGWQHADVLGPLRAVRDVPFALDTDVNAPALAEFRHAKASGECLSSCAYVTVGTGIGVGLVMNGAPVHGMMHPEGGHVCVPLHEQDVQLSFNGSNRSDTFGGFCAESMACSVALAQRAGLASTSELKHTGDTHEMWDAAAHYLGALCANIILLVSPERIVMSGGVMLRKSLFPRIRAATQQHLNGYLQLPQLTTQAGIDKFIVPSAWGNDAGLMGALTLAQLAHEKARATSPQTACASWRLVSRDRPLLFLASASLLGAALGVALCSRIRR
uniref:fructokinase n=1 Tax=Calcidiscus leptoporus TaxID=127549 RepID=A0A7S0P2Y6_9EUKA